MIDGGCSNPGCIDPDCDGRDGAPCIHEQCTCGNSVASIAAQISDAFHAGYTEGVKAAKEAKSIG